jgi:monoamine oxidase
VQFDVAIVGAGAAGLAAAREIARAGKTFVVLEARDRIGGRAFTDRSLGAHFDAGAHYIHFADRNPWTWIAKAAGEALVEQHWDRERILFYRDRVPEGPEAANARSRGWREAWDWLRSEPQDRSFAEAVEGAPAEVVEVVTYLMRFVLGEDPHRVSLNDFNALWDGPDLAVPGGYGALVERHHPEIPVSLRTPVAAIRWGGAQTELDTPAGTVTAAAVILTVPVGVLQAEAIAFAPVLPLEILRAVDGLGMGALTKIALRADRRIVGDLAETKHLSAGPGDALTRFDFWFAGQDLVVATLGGDHARGLCEAGEAAAVDFAKAELASLLGWQVRPALREGKLAGWWTDPWSRGGYSIAKPGEAAAREALQTPVGGRLFFAGEASAGLAAMTVGGATMDGQRAARAVLDLFR